jgi:hypothetical protein
MSGTQASLNYLIYGDFGTGKSHILSTSRLPLYVHSFDAGGTKVDCLRDLAEKNLAILDTSCENEDWKNPWAFAAWEKQFQQLYSSGAFNHIGTYALDSLSFFGAAIMNAVLKKGGRAGTLPQQQDYYYYRELLFDVVSKLSALPCDIVFTAHVSVSKDEVTGATRSTIKTVGSAKEDLPAVFDMVLLADVVTKTSGDPEYRVQVKPTARLRARARIGSSKLSPYEKPDLMAIRTKAGRPIDHLPPFA